MTISNSFEELSNVLRRIESARWTIEYVEPKGGKLSTDEPLDIEIGVSLPLLETLRDETNVQIKDLNVENSTNVITISIPAEGEGDADKNSQQEGAQKANGSDMTETGRSDDQSTSDRRLTDGDSELRVNESEKSRPPHHDPEQLREVYEEHDTFAEMTDALNVDVTPQTVRHYMIRHGIHEPATQSSSEVAPKSEDADDTDRQIDSETSRKNGAEESNTDPSDNVTNEESDNQSSADGSDEESSDDLTNKNVDERPSESTRDQGQRLNNDIDSDGDAQVNGNDPIERSSNSNISLNQLEEVSLPDDISIEDVKGAVQSASTMHEVQRALDLEGAETRNLLQELDLIDLVTGRLAYKPNQDTSLDELETATDSTEEIEKRIHDALNSASTSEV